MQAASVEAAFVLIDRATGPIRRIRREARAADDDLRKLGRTLDEIGDRGHQRQLDVAARGIKRVGAESLQTERGMGRMERRTGTVAAALRRFGVTYSGVTKLMRPAVWISIASAIGVAAGAVGALGGGVVALAPALVQTLGIAGAAPAVFTGMGLAAVTAKIALKGVGEALGGNEEALKRLTPRARKFVETLKGMKDEGEKLRSAAQGGLLGGLEKSLERLKRGVPVAERLLKGMSSTLGNLAKTASRRLTTEAALRDLEAIGGQGTRVVDRAGRGILNVLDAMRHVAREAEPFTDWLTKTGLGWTRIAKEEARVARQTGELDRYFRRTRSSLELFGSIASNVWSTLRGLGSASRETGKLLWQDIDHATASWDRYVNSVAGQHRLRTYFEGVGTNVRALAGLAGDLGIALMRMGEQPGVARVANILRRGVGPLEDLLNRLSNELGPGVADLLVEIIRLLGNLPLGPISMMVRFFNRLLRGVNALIERVPGVSEALDAAFHVGAVVAMIHMVRRLASTFAVATREALGMRAAVAGGGMIPGGRAGAAGPGGVVPVGGSGRQGLRNTYGLARDSGRGRLMSGAAAAGSMLPGIGGGARGVAGAAGGALLGGARALGRFAGPIAAVFALFDGISGAARTTGSAMDKVEGGLVGMVEGATFGLWQIETASERTQKAIVANTGALQRQVNAFAGQRDARSLTDMKNRIDAYRAAVIRGGRATPEMIAQLDALAAAAGRTSDQIRDSKVQKAWENQLTGTRRITNRTITNIIERMQGMSPAAQQATARAGIAQAKEARKRGDITKREYRLAVRSFRRILYQTADDAKGAGEAATDETRKWMARYDRLIERWGERMRRRPERIYFSVRPLVDMSKVPEGFRRFLPQTQRILEERGAQPLVPMGQLPGGPRGGGGRGRGRQMGGLVGGAPGQDRNVIRASANEYVMPEHVVRREGIGAMDAIRAGIPGFQDGGRVGRGRARGGGLGTDKMVTEGLRPMRRLKREGGKRVREATDEWRGGFEKGRRRTFKPVQELTRDIDRSQKKTRRDTKRTVEQTERESVRSWSQRRRGMTREQDRGERDVSSSSTRTRRNVTRDNEVVERNTDKTWTNNRKTMVANARGATRDVTTAFRQLKAEALKALAEMGVKGGEAQKALRGDVGVGRESGGGSAGGGSAAGGKSARGGRLRFHGGGRVRGYGRSDNVHLGGGNYAAHEELVVNRHTERRVNRKLMAAYGQTLEGEVRNEVRSHAADPIREEMAALRIGAAARGGRFGGGGRVTGDTDYLASLGKALNAMSAATNTPITVNSGRRTMAEQRALYAKYQAGTGNLAAVPNANAPHVRGVAADISPGREKFGSIAKRFGLGFTVPSEAWHIEILNAGKGGFMEAGGGGMPAIKLKERFSRRGGAPGALANRGMSAIRAAMEGNLNAGAGGMGAAPGAKGSYGMAELMALAKWAGMANPRLMAAIALAESGGQPGVTGGGTGADDGRGLWQIEWPVHSGWASKIGNPTNPRDNALMAARILKDQGLSAWVAYTNGSYRRYLERGGRMEDLAGILGQPGGERPASAGWNQSGGSFRARRPTVFGAGERGDEDVHIIPRRHGGRARSAGGPIRGGGGGLTVQHLEVNVENHRKGDVKKMMLEELEGFAEELAVQVADPAAGSEDLLR